MDLLATAQNRAAALAVSELEAAWAKTGSVNDPAALRDLLVEMMPSITRRYGGIAATAAAQWYDAVRATEVQADGFKAQADTQDDAADAAAGSARWAATPLFDGVDGAARAAAVDRAGEAVDRLVRESGRMTLESNARRDPAAKRWMIVPQGVTCAWCAMLASRGAAYLSEKTAAKSVHAHCDCQVVPDFGKGVQGFSAKPYSDLYDRARAEAGGDASAGEVLAVMRRLPGAGLSDGVGGGKPPRSGGGSGSGSSGGGNPPGGGSGSAGGWDGRSECRRTLEAGGMLTRSAYERDRRRGGRRLAYDDWVESKVDEETQWRDPTWLSTGKPPAVGYADERLGAEIHDARPWEARTAERLSRNGVRCVFQVDSRMITGPDGIERKVGLADLEGGTELKTLMKAASENTIGGHLHSCRKKTDCVRVVFDNAENEEMTDDELARLLRKSLRAKEKALYVLNHDGELVRIR